MREVALCQLSAILGSIERLEQLQPVNYTLRNDLVIGALSMARAARLEAGIRIDPEQPEWPVVFIELPTGQVSWHLPQHAQAWDGHTTAEKYQRVAALMADYPPHVHAHGER